MLSQKNSRRRPSFRIWLCIGLTFAFIGVALTATATSGVAAESAPYLQQDEDPTHTIRPGETLNKIADAYGVSASDLMRLNNISDSDAIYVGQTLKLPESLADEASDSPVDEPPSDDSPAGGDSNSQDEPLLPDITHTIQRGETLSEIAKAYDISMNDLMLLNGIGNADAVYAGQTLRLPPEAAQAISDEQEFEQESTFASDTEATDAKDTDAKDTDAKDDATETPDPEMADGIPVEETPVENARDGLDEEIAEQDDPEPIEEATDIKPVDESADEPADESIDELAEEPAEDIANEITDAAFERLADAPTGLTTSLNRIYQVRSGDTIIRIALRAGVDLEALRQLNGLTEDNDDQISVGQSLILPATASELFVEREDSLELKGETYEVQSGDSVGVIAEEYGISMAALLAANRITDPNAIYVGQILVIPSPLEDDQISASNVTVDAGRNGFYYYTVGPGDTLGKIAQQFDTTPQALVAYNGLPNLETAFLGLELRIPFGPPKQPIDRPRIPASGTTFMVSLSRQECWVYRGNKVQQQWTCSTGYGEWTTKKGTFAIKTKQELAKSSVHRLDMPYWLGIYDVGNFENGIHGLPTRWSDGQKIWTGLIGQPATFGCAMLTDDDAGQLFALSFLGMPVHVID